MDRAVLEARADVSEVLREIRSERSLETWTGMRVPPATPALPPASLQPQPAPGVADALPEGDPGGIADQIADLVRGALQAPETVAHPRGTEAEWRADEWLHTACAPQDVLSRALLRPLAEATHPIGPTGGVQHHFFHAFGQQEEVSRRAMVAALLRSSSFMEDLSRVVSEALGQLATAAATTCEQLNEKFIMEGARGIRFADFSKAEAGLVGIVGVPNADLLPSMQREHCHAADSQLPFRACNYQTKTTSEIEYYFVAEPGRAPTVLRCGNTCYFVGSAGHKWRAALRRLIAVRRMTTLRGRAAATRTSEAVAGAPSVDEAMRSTLDVGLHIRGWPQEAVAPSVGRRSAQPPDSREFEALRREKSNELQAVGMAPLRLEEFVGARLYTGPMYTKYNTILRALDERRNGPFSQQLKELCANNRYTTTLHVINSAVVKLSQLTPVATVYRGVSGFLPSSFLERNEHGALGGVDVAFLSTSRSRSTAVDYAGQRQPIVVEMEMGMTGRGADLSWLSQYPAEREILFPPLTTLEVVHTRIDGPALVVQLRPTVNRNNQTIEHVVAKMKLSFLQLVDSLSSELAFAGTPSAALLPFRSLAHSFEQEDTGWFNDPINYLQATRKVMSAQRQTLELLAQPSTWGEGGAVEAESALAAEERIMAVAEKCARQEAHDTAAALVRLSLPFVHSAGASHVEQLSQQAFERAMSRGEAVVSEEGDDVATRSAVARAAIKLLDRGIESPWPKTLAMQLELADDDELGLVQGRLHEMIRATPRFAAGCRVLAYHPLYRWVAGTVLGVLPDGRFELEIDASRGTERFVGERALGHEHVCVHAPHGPGALLREAARSGNMRLVSCILRTGASCCYEADSTCALALHEATRSGHASVCEALVRAAPASLWVPDLFGRTPRSLAYEKGDAAVLRVLEPSSVDSDVEESRCTPLMTAVWLGDEMGVRSLLDVEPERASRRTLRGTTALAMAAQLGHERIISMLVAACVPRKGTHDAGASRSPSSAPTDLERLEIDAPPAAVRSIAAVPSSSSACTSCSNRSRPPAAVDSALALLVRPLVLAARHAHEEVVRQLLDVSAPINTADVDGRTALVHAAMLGHAHLCTLLLDRDASVHHVDAEGLTALANACKYGHIEAVLVLLTRETNGVPASTGAVPVDAIVGATSHAARPNATDAAGAVAARDAGTLATRCTMGFTPLHHASRSGHADVCAALLRAGAAVDDATPARHETPLMLASQFGHAEAVLQLLDASASPELADLNGRTCLMLASRDGHTRSVMEICLRPAGRLIVDFVDLHGLSALTLACRDGHTGACAALLRAGACPDREDDSGRSPLVWAACNGHPQIVRELLAAGASPDASVGGEGGQVAVSSQLLAATPNDSGCAVSPTPPAPAQPSSLCEAASRAAADLQRRSFSASTLVAATDAASRAADFEEVVNLLNGARLPRKLVSGVADSIEARRHRQRRHCLGAGDFASAAHLRRWLGSHRLNLASWGGASEADGELAGGVSEAGGNRAAAKSVEQLFSELEADESVLAMDREGLVAKVRVVLPGRPELVLYEASRTLERTGRTKAIDKLLAQKMSAADDPIEAAQRGVRHKLGSFLGDDPTMNGSVRILSSTLCKEHESNLSPSYPQLIAGCAAHCHRTSTPSADDDLFFVTAVVSQLPEGSFTTREEADDEPLIVQWQWQPTDVGAHAFDDPGALRAWLSRHGVDTTSWGQLGANPLSALWHELQQQECVLYVAHQRPAAAGARSSAEGPPTVRRRVRVVELRILAPNRPRLALHLSRRTSAAHRGSEEMDSLFEATIEAAEEPRAAALHRLLARLGSVVRAQDVALHEETECQRTTISESSRLYPTLPTETTTYAFDVTVAGLPMQAFDTYEYADSRQTRIKTVLTWEWKAARRAERGSARATRE